MTEKPDSPRIILVRPGIFDPQVFTIQDAMRVTTMMLDYMLNEDDNFVIAGQIGILDLSGVTIQHFLQFNPVFIKKMTVLTQDAAPGRQKGLHWINTPRGFEKVFNLFTSFMNEKNRSRVSDRRQRFRLMPVLSQFCTRKTKTKAQTQISRTAFHTLSYLIALLSSSFSCTTTLSRCISTFHVDFCRRSMEATRVQCKASLLSGKSG